MNLKPDPAQAGPQAAEVMSIMIILAHAMTQYQCTSPVGRGLCPARGSTRTRTQMKMLR
jgi:hypothetical protein